MKDMLCPLCKSKLNSDGSFYYEDAALSECYSKKWICDNKDCELSTHKSYWNDDGDFWSGLSYINSLVLFPNRNYAAYNSFAKKCEVEIYKNGLKDKIYLSSLLTFDILKPYIEINYKGNEMGEVLKKSYKLRFLKRNGYGKFTIYYTSTLHMLLYNLKIFHKIKRKYKKNKSNISIIYSLNEQLSINSIRNTELYKKIFNIYLNIRYFKLKYNILEKKIYIDLVETYKIKYYPDKMTKERYEELEKQLPSDLVFFDILNHNNMITKEYMRNFKLQRILKN